MHAVRLAVEHTAETIHPMHAFVCESPAVERELLLEGRTDDGVRTLLFYVEGDPEAYEAVLADRSGVREYEVRSDDGGGFFLYVRAANAAGEQPLLEAFDRETVVVVPPVEFRPDATMRLTAVGPADDVRGVVEDLPDPVGVEILAAGRYDGVRGPTLSDRQREALAAARRVGYYEVPREGDLAAVAEELDCAPSSASTLLRRAERTLVADALERPVAAGDG